MESIFESGAGAKFSKDRVYRYALWRIWDESKEPVMFIGLNPSTADEVEDDPTLRRCMNFADNWGYGGVVMTNLFAYCATDPDMMKSTKKPIGQRNNQFLKQLASEVDLIVAAWGNHGAYLSRSDEVQAMLPALHYLKLNASGEPAHPLYLPGSLIPLNWRH